MKTPQTLSIDYHNHHFRLSIEIRLRGSDLIFFIHGLGCAKETFNDVWTFKELNDYSIITFDLPGFGESPGVDNFSYDIQEQAEICGCLLSHFPDYRIHIVGHSMGGAIGLLLAEQLPDRVKTFVNIEGNLISYDCSLSSRKASVSFENYRDKQVPAMIRATALSQEPGRKLWSDLIKKADTSAMYYSSRSLVTWSKSGVLLEKFIRLTCSKVYVYGEFDSFIKVLHMIKGMPAICISNSGHFPMNDNPTEFYQCLAQCIKH